MTPVRIRRCREVLDRAKDADDQTVISACRRIIRAFYIGKDRLLTSDWAIVDAFSE